MQLFDEISNSYELLKYLKEQKLLETEPEFWWPSNSCFEILLGAILTQNTKWTNVEKSLENLKALDLLSFEKLLEVNSSVLVEAITPSGFKNQKAQRLKLLSKNILEEYGDFDNFCQNVSRQWLLEQKGIGLETADAILCYACHQEHMVVDKYTQKLVSAIGFEFETYEDLQAWCEYGINENFDKITKLYGYEISLNKLYCRFHGKIVEFMKSNRLKAGVK